jgi:hypothetical protein
MLAMFLIIQVLSSRTKDEEIATLKKQVNEMSGIVADYVLEDHDGE